MAASTHDARKVVDRWDDVFHAVAAEPRRQLVLSLLEEPPDAAVALPGAAVNPNLDVDERALATPLRHHHLPLLADLSFVEWTEAPFEARRGRRFDEVGVVFEALQAAADDLPDSLTVGCRRLEAAQRADGTTETS